MSICLLILVVMYVLYVILYYKIVSHAFSYGLPAYDELEKKYPKYYPFIVKPRNLNKIQMIICGLTFGLLRFYVYVIFCIIYWILIKLLYIGIDFKEP